MLLFSATLSHRVLELAYEHMHEAEKLVVESDNVTADKVRQLVYFPAKEEKMPLLLNLIDQHKPTRSIIFVNTKAAAERITERVKRHGCRVGAISGDVPQLKRQKLLQRFKDSQLDILVATDVAARGLHIPEVSHVFNYDLPHDAEDYVHRIGRTARLGAEGDAISFACDLYAMSLPDIETYIGQSIPVAQMDPELLVMPKPRAVDAEFAANTAADSAAFGDVVPPRPGEKPRGSRSSGDRSGSGRGEGTGSRPPRQRKPRAEKPQVEAGAAQAGANQAETQPGQPIATSVEAGNQIAAGGAPGDGGQEVKRKPRRRRGGRNRSKNKNASTTSETQTQEAAPAGNDSAASPASRTERRPPRPSRTTEPTAPVSRPSRQVEATAASNEHAAPHKSPGLFRRLSRMFTSR